MSRDNQFGGLEFQNKNVVVVIYFVAMYFFFNSD